MAPVRAGLKNQPPIAGAILAGGGSRRFGADKGLAETPQGPLAGIVLAALRAAGVDPVVLIGGSSELSAALAIPSIPDQNPGAGPLAGLGTALGWASGVTRIVVAPCDMPLITSDVIRTLVNRGNNTVASIAMVDDRLHPILACWPTQRWAAVKGLLRDGERRMQAAIETGDYVAVPVDSLAVRDADCPEDLALLLNSAPVDLE
ncbi:MAG: molybdenum cofactor guanylyltransferase [Acidimicrobiales bacterium]|nr:molybdenum cofactor guanylyltransferase [Acidimicrobiales bacterium]